MGGKTDPVKYVCAFLLCSFDQGGNYLLTGASDAYVYLLDPKPSKRFIVIGYTGRYLVLTFKKLFPNCFALCL